MTTRQGASAQQQSSSIAAALQSNPLVAVSLVDCEGKVVFVNEQAARLFLDDSPKNCIGRSLYELFPRKWADERILLFGQAQQDGRSRVLRSIRNGRQIQSTITPLGAAEPGGKPRFLVVTVPGQHDIQGTEGSFDVVESAYADLGPLDVLTQRELEVLALVKQGLTNREIGKLLFRSAKTVENHIGVINQKLHTSSRVQLALIAQRAGLELSDAHLERVR
ncbi:MAG: helix-turn-helix transcriptional regulator [Phycisphaerales bacterium]|nr:helix-turn-helix transcriptional regulator [Phycisphaerales bacterium]